MKKIALVLTEKEASVLYLAALTVKDDLNDYFPDEQDKRAWVRALEKMRLAARS